MNSNLFFKVILFYIFAFCFTMFIFNLYEIITLNNIKIETFYRDMIRSAMLSLISTVGFQLKIWLALRNRTKRS